MDCYPVLKEITEDAARRQGYEQMTHAQKKGTPMGETQFGGRMPWLAWLHCEADRINRSGTRYRAAVVYIPMVSTAKVSNDRHRGWYFLAVRRMRSEDPIEDGS